MILEDRIMSVFEFASQNYDSAVLDMHSCLKVQAEVLRADGDQELADTIFEFLSESDADASRAWAH